MTAVLENLLANKEGEPLLESKRPYFGLIAAAGLSSRMGQSKALMKNPAGETFVSHLVQGFLASGCRQLWVTVPNNDDEANEIRNAVLKGCLANRHGMLHFQKNRFEKLGLMGSIWTVLDERLKMLSNEPEQRSIQKHWPLLFCPVDLPGMDAETACKLVEASENHRVVVPVYEGISGHPVACAPAVFSALRAHHEGGARVLFEKIGVGVVEVSDENSIKNVNTPTELGALFQKHKG